jgi:RTX calcium-binding nonapeptide repeat (4 copies)
VSRFSLLVLLVSVLAAAGSMAATGAGERPANDDFTAAELLKGTGSSVFGTTKGATKQPGEPSHAGNSGGGSIWYRWQSENAVILTLTTEGSSFDTLLAVYTGATLETLTEVASNDDDTGVVTSRVRLDASAGTEYRIAIDGYAGAVGAVNLAWSEAPLNDDFDQAEVILGEEGSLEASNEGATEETDEPRHADVDGGTSLWYTWTAPRSAMMRFETGSSLTEDDEALDTVLAIYRGQSLDDLTPIAANDDFLGLSSAVSFAVTEGTVYSIAVTGFNAKTGDIVLSWFPGAILLGTDARNTLTGTPGRDYIDGKGGDDTLSGGDGDDELIGGEGADRLRGEAGNDRLDTVDSVRGNDTLRGGNGRDVCRSDRGDRERGCP